MISCILYSGKETLLNIANAFYDDSSLWWRIAMRNSIIDPTAEIYAGRAIYIPPKGK
jgi:nucleoid-associated protein YgaU